MKRFKLNILTILAVFFSLSLVTTSCGDDDDPIPTVIEDLDGDGIADADDPDIDGDGVANAEDGDPRNPDVGAVIQDVRVSGFLTEDQTWTNDRFWILDGKTYVQDGVTLTIDPGTIIKGAASTGSNASALIVARGGTLIADGDAQNPIIFTAEADNIELGTTAGTNLTVDDRQLWGGFLVLGKAIGSFSGDAESIQIEGIPPNEPGSYGGTQDNDNSGIIRYVSVRHGGAVIGSDNEINGITLGAVGSATQISNLEVVGNLDDGLEIFGGTVSVNNVVVWGCADDQFDLDEAYSGTLSNIVSVQENVSDHALESDGPAGSLQRGYTINGWTLVGDSSPVVDGVSGNREYIDFREGNLADIKNVYAFGFRPGSDVELNEDDFDDNDVFVAPSQDALNYNAGLITFENWQVVLPEGDTISGMFKDTSDAVETTFSSDAAAWTTAIQEGEQTVGANLGVFDWTFTAINGKL